MAFFIVTCGALLMIGGAASLLMGFDIVMTDRGAAMAIGGTVALAGGVVAVGIGGVLVRLRQILRALEQRPPKPKTSVPDRPVVVVKQPDVTEAALSPTPTLAAGAAVTGAVAGGLIMSREAVAAESKVLPLADEPPVKAPDAILESLRAESVAEPTVDVVAPADLEDELARALAEVEEPPLTPTAAAASEISPLKAEGRRRSWFSHREPEPEVEPLIAVDEPPVADEPAPTAEVEADVPLASEEVQSDPDAGPTLTPVLSDDDDLKPTPSKPKVLGTYNVGGRTYSMYADGAVEAVTETGIERFASMDDLRRHLAKTS